ncbi:hypothetical protein OS493_000845 [Desmophyllum pertusum]|uniref:Hexosyltransferase n=1 Tax=Desmophyllum pertusum TaxID=174260 RepID=A0A9W9ZUQ3_9CNID|nr:hypothetical protein OS493_000845 [Desmophyllum pertusum]
MACQCFTWLESCSNVELSEDSAHPIWWTYTLLILVSSAPANLQRRNKIRKTWAFESAFKPRWTTAFLVAQSRIQAESNLLVKEDEVYGDLVRADYYDHYWNQTLKIQMSFEWATRHCKFSFLLKVDDDVFVNPERVLSFLSEPSTPKEKLYAGEHRINPVHSEMTGRCLRRMLANKTGIKIMHNAGFEPYPPIMLRCSPHEGTLSRIQAESNSLIKEEMKFMETSCELTTTIITGIRPLRYKWFRMGNQTLQVFFSLKVDDDVFVNPERVLSFLSEPSTPKEKLYAGEHRINPRALRDGKWKITIEEYSKTHYPDFCPGLGFVLSHDVVVSFVKAFDFVPYFRLDDVYVGMLANKTGIKIMHNAGFESYPPIMLRCSPHEGTLVRHGTEGYCLIEMFKGAIQLNSNMKTILSILVFVLVHEYAAQNYLCYISSEFRRHSNKKGGNLLKALSGSGSEINVTFTGATTPSTRDSTTVFQSTTAEAELRALTLPGSSLHGLQRTTRIGALCVADALCAETCP